jgi:plasmid stabilization system protein ParE
MSSKLDLINGDYKEKVVKSVYYYKDIQDIFEYGEATFGEKAALSFFDELLMDT